jgi:hypothetical protein
MKVGRSNMMICPFHDDHHPSLKLYPDHFHCFGCHASGDVITFVGRLFNLPPYEAARKIMADFHIDPTAPSSAAALPMGEQLREAELKCQGTRCVRALVRFENLLKKEQEQYAPATMDEPWNDRFARACNALPQISQYLDDLFDADITVRQETAYDLISSGEIERIEKILAQERKEKSHGEDPCRAA